MYNRYELTTEKKTSYDIPFKFLNEDNIQNEDNISIKKMFPLSNNRVLINKT